MIRRINLVFLGVALAASTSAREEYSRAIDKTVPWSAGARVYLEHSMGDITVHTHAEPQVVIHADIHRAVR